MKDWRYHLLSNMLAKKRRQVYERGDIWTIRPGGFANRGDKTGPVPWLIIQHDALNETSSQVVVACITDGLRKPFPKKSWTSVLVEKSEGNGLKKRSVVDCSNICTVHLDFFDEFWGEMSFDDMTKVDIALKNVLVLGPIFSK
jgi:mRNA-degrading endonuclease toxin of MazEF toxin-antitoxin module